MKMIINVILHRFCELIRQHCLIFTRYRNLCEPKTIKSQSIDDQIHSHRTWQLCDDSILIGQFVFMETCTQFPKMYLHLRITCINSNSKKEHALKCPIIWQFHLFIKEVMKSEILSSPSYKRQLSFPKIQTTIYSKFIKN